MNEQKLRLLLDQQKGLQTSPGNSCPGDDRIARLIKPLSPDEDITALKAHIADCPYCASRVANAFRLPATRRDGATPGLRNIAIAAAVAVVAVTSFWLRPDLESIPSDHAELRNVRQPETMPALIFPTEGQTVSPAGMMVRWTPVDDAMHYSVRIVDDYGRIVIDSFADAPEFRVPSHIRLAPGANYYVKIDAYVVGDKAVSSSHISFTVAD
ncbi:hypothetical protein GWP57_15350 [Gammaproteobacteria bacterium]|jgi:hypothetical protein|nr:hypothetical protein [Gammaproteobacteria bacterium]